MGKPDGFKLYAFEWLKCMLGWTLDGLYALLRAVGSWCRLSTPVMLYGPATRELLPPGRGVRELSENVCAPLFEGISTTGLPELMSG